MTSNKANSSRQGASLRRKMGLTRFLAAAIRHARAYLSARGYTLEDLCCLTEDEPPLSAAHGPGAAVGSETVNRLHKNSVMRIPQLVPNDGAALKGSQKRPPWDWNPQLSTVEQLEPLVHEAMRLGMKLAPWPRKPRYDPTLQSPAMLRAQAMAANPPAVSEPPGDRPPAPPSSETEANAKTDTALAAQALVLSKPSLEEAREAAAAAKAEKDAALQAQKAARAATRAAARETRIRAKERKRLERKKLLRRLKNHRYRERKRADAIAQAAKHKAATLRAEAKAMRAKAKADAKRIEAEVRAEIRQRAAQVRKTGAAGGKRLEAQARETLREAQFEVTALHQSVKAKTPNPKRSKSMAVPELTISAKQGAAAKRRRNAAQTTSEPAAPDMLAEVA